MLVTVKSRRPPAVETTPTYTIGRRTSLGRIPFRAFSFEARNDCLPTMTDKASAEKSVEKANNKAYLSSESAEALSTNWSHERAASEMGAKNLTSRKLLINT